MAETLGRWVRAQPGRQHLTPARYPWLGHSPVLLDGAPEEEQEAPAPIRAADLSPSTYTGAGLVRARKSLLDGQVEIVDPRGLEWKSAPGGAGTTVSDEGSGRVTCLASVTGIVDRVADNVLPGAYADTLTQRMPKVIQHHDWRLTAGKVLEAAELRPGARELPSTLPDGTPWPSSAGGLACLVQFNLKTQRGREAYEDTLFYGVDQEWSIGYHVPEGQSRRGQNGVREIKRLDLYEVSTVLFGAMPFARSLQESPV